MNNIQKRVIFAKKEISKDIFKGIVPKTIKSFSELHNYVDVNKYLFNNFIDSIVDFDLFNKTSSIIDQWLKNSRPIN